MNSSHRQIARAAGVVMAAFLVSRLFGVARDMVIAAQLGTSDAADAYRTAFLIPDLIFTLIAGGALASAFIPTFAGYLAEDNREGAWHLASAVINLLLVVMGVAAALAFIAAPALAFALAPGYAPDKQALTVSLMRVMLICPVIFGVSGLVMGILNAQQDFLLPGLAPSAYNLGIMLGAWLLIPKMGPMGAAIGAVAGAMLHLLVQIPGLANTPGPSPTPAPATPTATPLSGTANVYVFLYNDRNGDSLRQADEPVIPGGAVSLSNKTGTFTRTADTQSAVDPACPAELELDKGYLCFVDFPVGEYNITVAIPDGYNPTTELSRSFQLKGGDETYISFGAQANSEKILETAVIPESPRRSPILVILGGVVLLAGIGLGIYAALIARR